MDTCSPNTPVLPPTLIRSFKNFSKEEISKISSAAGSVQSMVNFCDAFFGPVDFFFFISFFFLGHRGSCTSSRSSNRGGSGLCTHIVSCNRKQKKASQKFTIDCTEPAADENF